MSNCDSTPVYVVYKYFLLCKMRLQHLATGYGVGYISSITGMTTVAAAQGISSQNYADDKSQSSVLFREKKYI